MATRLNIILLAEDEFDLYAKSTCDAYSLPLGNIAEMDAWEQLFEIPLRFPKFASALRFTRSTFWMVSDCAEACRQTLACRKNLHPEMDPSKPEHVAIFMEFCAIFARSLSVVVCSIFKAYLHPANQADLSEALLVLLYGGRESYTHRNELYKLVKANSHDQAPPDLSLPEWERFLQLVRQCLDAPFQLQKAPLILREIGFSALRGDETRAFARTLCSETPQGARFAVHIPTYLAKAAKLPPEFVSIADQMLLPLLTAK